MSLYGKSQFINKEDGDNPEPSSLSNDTMAATELEDNSATDKVSETLIFSPDTPLSETIDGQTPIQNRWCFWYTKKASKYESYEQNIKPIQPFSTVEGFWQIYNHLVRPADLPNSMDLNLFKEGTKPMWEDVNNKRGGKWVVRLKKGLASRYWEELLLAMIGEQFDVGNEICGAVVSIRFSEDMLAIWNRNADNQEALLKIRDHLRRVCKFPHWVNMEYRRHDQSLGGGAPVPPVPDGSTPVAPTAPYSRVNSATFTRPLNRSRGSFTSRDDRGDFARSRMDHQEGGERSTESRASPLRGTGSSDRSATERQIWNRGNKWGER